MRLCTLLFALFVVLAFPLKSAAQSFREQTFVMKDISKKYDVSVRVACHDWACSEQGIVRVLRKNTDSLVQQIITPHFDFFLPQPLDSLLRRSSAQGASGNVILLKNSESRVYFTDYDFDGNEDIAIPNRNADKIFDNGATFDIYTFNPAQNLFVLHKGLTEIQHETSNVLYTHPERKEVIFTAREGCCWETIAHFIWLGKGATKRLKRIYEFNADRSDTYPEITESVYKLVKGKWVLKVKKHRKYKNNCD
jgi:hypothetical protein